MSASLPLAIKRRSHRADSPLSHLCCQLVELAGAPLDRAPVLLGLAHLVEDLLGEIGGADRYALIAHRIHGAWGSRRTVSAARSIITAGAVRLDRRLPHWR